MKKLLFLIFTFVLLTCSLFAFGVSAEDVQSPVIVENAPYALFSDGVPGRYFLFEYDGENDPYSKDPIAVLFTDEYLDFLDQAYSDYSNGSSLEGESFIDYMCRTDLYTAMFSENIEFVQKFEAVKKESSTSGGSSGDNSGGAGGGSGTGGGNEGESGGSSSGSQTGGPNVDTGAIPPNMEGEYHCHCSLSGGATMCDCFVYGYEVGWGAAMHSEELKAAILEAYNQGFREVNNESFDDFVANEKEEAIKEYKESEDYQKEIERLNEEAKKEALKEYKESEDYVNDVMNNNTDKSQEIKDKIIQEFKDSPEMAEIIGEAEAGAKADFVVEMESIVAGNSTANTGVHTDMLEVIEKANGEAVNEFADKIESIVNGQSFPSTSVESELSDFINLSISQSYEKGNAEGKENYKTSAEHRLALENEFTAGSEAGYSSGYINGSKDGYAEGLLDGAEAANVKLYEMGVTEYKNSAAYNSELKGAYKKGYDDRGDEEGVNPLLIIIPALALDVALALFLIFRKKKSKK